MATIAGTSTTNSGADGDQRVVLRGVGWKGYLTLLRLRGEHPRPKVIYLDGDVHLMSPSFAHEFLKKRLGHLVMVVVEELDIPCIPSGETTFRRKKKNGGVEGDESFYLTNLEPILAKKGKADIHLRRDPPPDLVIEAVNTHEAGAAVEVWRRFRVPEVWVCGGDSFTILALQEDNHYAESRTSVAFPFLTASEIHEWANRPQNGSETEWIKALRKWVAGTLAERVVKNATEKTEGASDGHTHTA
jgi:Uma2 family endonuclease